MSTDGILLEANHTSLDFVGIKPQDVIGKPFWETPWWTHSPEMQQKLKDAIYDAAGGKTVRFEASHKDSNGLLHFVDFSLKPIKDETGKVVLLIPEGRDITEQKLVENVLRESEAKLSAMFESSRDAIGVAKKGTHIFANPSYLKLFGFEKNEQIIGTSILNSIAPSHRQFMLQNVEHRSDGEPAPTFYESRGLKTDGTEFDAEFNVSTYELNGEIYSLANIRDITERKHAERNLKISEEKFSKLFLSSPDAILLAELKSGKIVEVNSGFEKFSGYSRDELLGQLVLDLNMYSAEDRLKFISLLKVHGNFHDVEFKLKNKAGERLLVLASAELIQINEELHTITILHDITERRQAEQKIRESEERFRLILENMPILLNAFDENRNIIDWNKACEETTGYSADEVIGNTKVMGLLYPDPEYQEKVWNTSLDPTNKNNTFDLVAKNGETRTVEWFDTYLHLAIPGWDSWGMGLDITERMKAEKSLLESEERYRLLVENMPIGMVVSQNDVIVYVNSVLMQIMKVQNESDAIGKSIFDFISPEFWVKSKERREKLTESTPVADLAEFKLVGFDNTLVDVETLAVRILFNGSPAILNLLTDITERKLANEKLQESEKRYRDLSDLLPQTVFETDLNGMLTYVNKIGYDQFGYTQADFKNGLSAFNMLIPRDRELAMQNMKAVITGESSSTNEYTALKKDGSTFPVIIKTNAVIHNGIYTGLRGIIFDITEIRQAQETLRKSEEKYSRIVNTANEGIRIVDTDFIITYVNAQMAKMLGYMPDEMQKPANGKFYL